jgi:hypothetical protein
VHACGCMHVRMCLCLLVPVHVCVSVRVRMQACVSECKCMCMKERASVCTHAFMVTHQCRFSGREVLRVEGDGRDGRRDDGTHSPLA